MLTVASKPVPHVQKNGLPSIIPWSIALLSPMMAVLMAASLRIGICRSRASPLPEPHGMMASAVCEPMSARPTSLTVPSPPTAMMRSALPAYCFAISSACPAWRVVMVSCVIPASSRRAPIIAASLSLPCVPACGLIMTTTCGLSILTIFFGLCGCKCNQLGQSLQIHFRPHTSSRLSLRPRGVSRASSV